LPREKSFTSVVLLPSSIYELLLIKYVNVCAIPIAPKLIEANPAVTLLVALTIVDGNIILILFIPAIGLLLAFILPITPVKATGISVPVLAAELIGIPSAFDIPICPTTPKAELDILSPALKGVKVTELTVTLLTIPAE
jgi:hypothetical protein